jgi:MFS family permease
VRHPLLRPLAACTATLNLFSMMAQAVLLLFAVRSLDLTPGTIGGILTAGNVGFLLGAFTAARLARRIGIGPAVIGAAAVMGVGNTLLPFASKGFGVSLIVGYGVLATFAGGIYNINVRSLAQTITPDRMLGRMVATMRFIVWGTIPVGAFVGGLLGEAIGLRQTLAVAAVGELLGFIPPLLSPVRRLLTIPEQGVDSEALESGPALPSPTGLVEPAVDPD